MKSFTLKTEKKDNENCKLFSLTTKNITPDGNCFFRAFSHQLYGTEEHHFAIRHACIYHIEHKSKYYKRFIGDKIFKKYIKRKRESGVWADNIEIHALSEIYNVLIIIYMAGQDPIKICNVEGSPSKTVRVFYKNMNHYDSVISIENKELESDNYDNKASYTISEHNGYKLI